MSFVGLPREFCIHALMHNNDNVEEAASWSFDNFNNWSAEQAHAQALSIQQERRSSHTAERYFSPHAAEVHLEHAAERQVLVSLLNNVRVSLVHKHG
jgi:hypothetical protein